MSPSFIFCNRRYLYGMNPYLFTSQRLGFRTWRNDDIDAMAVINADPEVMRYFPNTQDREQTASFVARMQGMYEERGYCYFALETLEDGRFIGFTGLMWQDYGTSFSPCTDIGWRLATSAWGMGYATEAAKRCLQYAFKELKLETVVAAAPRVNLPSIHVMQKAGMEYLQDFSHPRLKGDLRLERCVLYGIEREQFGNE